MVRLARLLLFIGLFAFLSGCTAQQWRTTEAALLATALVGAAVTVEAATQPRAVYVPVATPVYVPVVPVRCVGFGWGRRCY